MNPKLAALQTWINAKGHKPQLVVDGKPGPATRAAFLAIFANRGAPAVTDDEMAAYAARLGGSLKQMRAVAAVESGGAGFLVNGLPKILWERHHFWKRLQLNLPLISNPKPGGYTLDANGNGVNDSWEKLTEAAMHAPAWAIESCSWGRFQVMGFWWKALGYPSAIDFAWSMRESEAGHFDALVRYIQHNKLAGAFRALSTDPETCRAFAKGYNGSGYRKFEYHIKLARAMR
jgi:hypothetical protein